MTPAFSRHPIPTSLLSLSSRSATLVLAALGTTANSYATYKILSAALYHRALDNESESEGLFSWKVDGARALAVIVCAYFFVGAIASAVGLVGVLKVRAAITSNRPPRYS